MGELIPTLTVKNVGELETADPIGASLGRLYHVVNSGGVTTIVTRAFSKFKEILSVTIPSSLKTDHQNFPGSHDKSGQFRCCCGRIVGITSLHNANFSFSR